MNLIEPPTIYRSLTVVTLLGFDPGYTGDPDEKPDPEFLRGTPQHFIDLVNGRSLSSPKPKLPASLCRTTRTDAGNEDEPIITFDYQQDGREWSFVLLIETDRLDEIRLAAAGLGYAVERARVVNEPMQFYYEDAGDSCEIVRHSEGWAVLWVSNRVYARFLRPGEERPKEGWESDPSE